MTQATETTQTATARDDEPDLIAMVSMMVAVENAEFRDLPVGPVTPFPSVDFSSID